MLRSLVRRYRPAITRSVSISVRQADCMTFPLHQATSGSVISPSSALAAAVATDER